MDNIRHHYSSRYTGSSSHYVHYINKITWFYTILASITDTNLIQTLFRCTQTVDKSPTKAIWIIYIILAESRTRHALPMRIQTLINIQIIFQMLILSNGQSGRAAMTRHPSQMPWLGVSCFMFQITISCSDVKKAPWVECRKVNSIFILNLTLIWGGNPPRPPSYKRSLSVYSPTPTKAAYFV